MKVLTVVGTRPEIIRLSRVTVALDEYVDHVLVHTGQNYDYELCQVFFDDLSLRKPDYFLDAAGLNPVSTLALTMSRLDEVYEKERPDATLILGESNSGLATYAAKRRKIPIFHVDAGKRAYDQRVPEEINRRLIDALADVNMPCSSVARVNLLHEGFPLERVFQITSPMREVFWHYADKIEASAVLERLGIRPFEYFVVSVHREENVDDPEQLNSFVETLNFLAETERKPVIFSVHPRTRKRLEASERKLAPTIRLLRPLGFHDYNALQKNAFAVLSDSGALDEESALLDFPAISLRHTRERCEIDESSGAIMTGVERARVADALEIIKRKKRTERDFRANFTAQDLRVSERIAQIVVSYADYVDRFVWHKK